MRKKARMNYFSSPLVTNYLVHGSYFAVSQNDISVKRMSHSNHRNYMGFYLSFEFNVCNNAFFSLLQNASKLVN